jgi:hypothetical protein
MQKWRRMDNCAKPEDAPEDLVFEVTGYEGFEEEILRLRNANRAGGKSRRYLDWRYGERDPEVYPRIYWLRTAGGDAVGMAALIFRAYWVNGERVLLAILGDISVDKCLRNHGLGHKLLDFLSQDLAQNFPASPGFVIPTPVAEKALVKVGWRRAGEMVPHVLPLSLSEVISRVARNEWIGTRLARPLERFGTWVLRRNAHGSGLRVAVSAEVDGAFEEFWSLYPKRGLILRDRGKESLTWRYLHHPEYRFQIARILRADHLAGFIVFELPANESVCIIHDVVIGDDRDFIPAMAIFALYIISLGGFRAIRIVVSDAHPCRRLLWRLGFVSRPPQAVFQVFSSAKDAQALEAKWQLTSGDKDI